MGYITEILPTVDTWKVIEDGSNHPFYFLLNQKMCCDILENVKVNSLKPYLMLQHDQLYYV